VAPLWAGLIALVNQALPKPVGFLNSLLYKNTGPMGILRDIAKGNNDVDDNIFGHIKGYLAGTGWDACTGWGSPDGSKLLNFLLGKS
jgi:kumamolisin